MALPKYVTTVTTFSKWLALILFFALPVIGFFLGEMYQKIASNPYQVPSTASSFAAQGYPTPTNMPNDNSNNYHDYFSLTYPHDWIKTVSNCNQNSNTSLRGLGITKIFSGGTAAITICVHEVSIQSTYQIVYINNSADKNVNFIRDQIVTLPFNQTFNGYSAHIEEHTFSGQSVESPILPTYMKDITILNGNDVYVMKASFGLTNKNGDFEAARRTVLPQIDAILKTMTLQKSK